MQSAQQNEALLMTVEKTSGGVRFQEIVNFHESDAKFVIANANQITHIEGRDISQLALTVESETVFTIRNNNENEHRYIWVGSAGTWVGEQVVGGIYVDEFGRRYIFGKNGIAHFPDKKFSYEAYLDFIPTPHDCIVYNNEHWAFRRQNDVLQLFATSPVVPEEIAPKPSLVLHRTH